MESYKLLLLWMLFFATFANAQTQTPTPIVLWHGMGDSCCNPLSMGYIKKLLKTQIPGVYVNSLMLGSSVVEDMERGFFSNMNDLVAEACAQVKADENLQNGFHAMGFSQGGLFVRALAQRCSGIKIRNVISIGGPQQGIYGLPYCPGTTGLCNAVRHLLDYGAYSKMVQKISVQAQYWHDPMVKEHYATKSIFLADLNCEQKHLCNSTYKANLLKLETFVLLKFLRDEMVLPKESEWFGYYPPDDSSTVVPFEDTRLYKEDLIGLKQLNETGRLHFVSIDGQHLHLPTDIFVHEIIDKYLRGTSPTRAHSSLESESWANSSEDES